MEYKTLKEIGHIVGCTAGGPRSFWTLVGPWRYTGLEPKEVTVLVYTEDLLKWKKTSKPNLYKLLEVASDDSKQAPNSFVCLGLVNGHDVKVIVVEPPRSFGISEVFCSLLMEDKESLLRVLKIKRNENLKSWPKSGFIYTQQGELFANLATTGVEPLGPLQFPSAKQFLEVVGKGLTGGILKSNWKELKDINWS
jgi:hypothetical protein